MDDIENQLAAEINDIDLNPDNLEAMENMDMDIEVEAMNDGVDD